jgi:hypothetical protein
MLYLGKEMSSVINEDVNIGTILFPPVIQSRGKAFLSFSVLISSMSMQWYFISNR